MNILKHIILSGALAGMFLSAGAFAKSDVTALPQLRQSNVTVIYKTSDFPRIIFIKSCRNVTCWDV